MANISVTCNIKRDLPDQEPVIRLFACANW